MYQSAFVPAPARLLMFCARSASRAEVEFIDRIARETGSVQILRVNSLTEMSVEKVASSDLVLIIGWQAHSEEVGFVETFRRLEPTKPLIIVAASDDAELREIAFVKGADNYLSPGFGKDELAAKVNRLIARSDSDFEPAPITLSTLRIWPEQRIVMQGKDRVLLSRRELAMVLCLAENSPRPVTREHLEREAFGLRYGPGTNVVAVHIHRLRSKLQDGADVLKTVPGKGYQLC